MATSLVWVTLERRASIAAPVPRPPQPTRATWVGLLLAAKTLGAARPTSALAAATWPTRLPKSRRERPVVGRLFMRLSLEKRFVVMRLTVCARGHPARAVDSMYYGDGGVFGSVCRG